MSKLWKKKAASRTYNSRAWWDLLHKMLSRLIPLIPLLPRGAVEVRLSTVSALKDAKKNMPELANTMSGPMQGLLGGESKRHPQITIQQVQNGYTIAIPMKAVYVARTLDEVLATVRGKLTTPDIASIEDGPESA